VVRPLFFAMPDSAASVFLVNAGTDPVIVRIQGRACFTNSGGLKDFLAEMIRLGRSRFVLDFSACTGMDSTFLGILAGTALQLRRLAPPGGLTLARVGERNLELIRNLGLHRLAVVDAGAAPLAFPGADQALADRRRDELEQAKLVLEAHENLVETDAGNAARFQDVLSFLRSRVSRG